METKIMFSFNVTFLLCALFIHACLTEDKGLRLIVKNITDCEIPSSDDQLKVTTNLVEKNGEFVLNAALDLPYDVDNNILYNVKTSIWSNRQNSWRKFFELNGAVCEGLEKIVPNLWKVVAEAAKANVECPIKAGHYELADFSVDGEQAALPFAAKGLFLVEARALRDGNCVLCKIFQVEGVN